MTQFATTFRKDEVLVLLGAGASVEADIPHSGQMIREIEESLKVGSKWADFAELYHYVRSAIFYAEGIRGSYEDVSYNVERLMVCLDELSRREEHPLYPFVGAWNPRLLQVAHSDFGQVARFKSEILKRLRSEWIEISDYQKADYFRGLLKFRRELEFPLRVFTLNYDLCVEKACIAEVGEPPERGFASDRTWNYELLDDGSNESKQLYLYKLHGSIDWLRMPDSRKLTFSDSTAKITPEQGELIFGTTYKLQYVDPYLFLAYQFRRRSLDARLLIAVGYGFGDEHINAIVGQALNSDPSKKLVAVTKLRSDVSGKIVQAEHDKFRDFALNQLKLQATQASQIVIKGSGAKQFLSQELTLSEMAKIFPKVESVFD